MKISTGIIAALLVLVVTSCKTRMTQQEFVNSRRAVFFAYCTNNVNAAQATLLTDLQTISRWESNHLEGTDFNIDYDACKEIDHKRLFLIYRAMHETNKMQFEYEQTLDCQARSHYRNGLPPSSITPDEIVEGLNKLEGNENVRWKTNIDLEELNRTTSP